MLAEPSRPSASGDRRGRAATGSASCASDVREFRSLVSYVCDALYGGDGGAATAKPAERRRLHVSQLLDGMVAIDGLLDREAGEILVPRCRDGAALRGARATCGRRHNGAPMPWCTLCEAAAAGIGAGDQDVSPALVSVDVDLEVLERRAGPTLVRRVRGDGAQLGRLSAETLRRIACDAGVTRVVTDGASAPLDVGRTTRVVSPALWRALVVRDGGCVAPGCDRPPGWCDAHHRVHWVDGGATSLDNLELRCRRHHRAVHEGRVRRPGTVTGLTRVPRGPLSSPPDRGGEMTETQGWTAPGFESVRDAFGATSTRATRSVPRSARYHRGQKVVDLWGGIADEHRPAVGEDSIVLVFSTTKGLTAVCANKLARRRASSTSTRRSRSTGPSSRQAGKEDVPVSYLLSHQVGLPESTRR